MSKGVLAINITKGYSDERYADTLSTALEGTRQVEVANAHSHDITNLHGQVREAIAHDKIIISSGSDLNILRTLEDGATVFNAEAKTVAKVVNLFTFLLTEVLNGKINPEHLRILLICFSAQAFSLSLTILDEIIKSTGQSSFPDLTSLLESDFEASRFFAPATHHTPPVYKLETPRIGTKPLADGSTEVFFHTQAVRAACLNKLNGLLSLEVEDSTPEGIVNRFSILNRRVRGVQYHPELDRGDFRSMKAALDPNHPFKIPLASALEEETFRPPSLYRYVQ